MNNERRLIQLFNSFVDRFFLPQITKFDGQILEWKKFSSMLSISNIDFQAIQSFIDSIGTSERSPINFQRPGALKKKKEESNTAEFQPETFNPNKTFGGQKARGTFHLKNQSDQIRTDTYFREDNKKNNYNNQQMLLTNLEKVSKMFNQSSKKLAQIFKISDIYLYDKGGRINQAERMGVGANRNREKPIDKHFQRTFQRNIQISYDRLNERSYDRNIERPNQKAIDRSIEAPIIDRPIIRQMSTKPVGERSMGEKPNGEKFSTKERNFGETKTFLQTGERGSENKIVIGDKITREKTMEEKTFVQRQFLQKSLGEKGLSERQKAQKINEEKLMPDKLAADKQFSLSDRRIMLPNSGDTRPIIDKNGQIANQHNFYPANNVQSASSSLQNSNTFKLH